VATSLTITARALKIVAMLDQIAKDNGPVMADRTLAHVRKAITKAVPSARIVEGDIFGAVGKGLTLEALRRYGPGE